MTTKVYVETVERRKGITQPHGESGPTVTTDFTFASEGRGYKEVYEALREQHLYISRQLEGTQADFTGKDFPIVQWDRSDRTVGREYTKDTITVLRLNENHTCTINEPMGLFIVHGTVNKSSLTRIVQSDESVRRTDEFAIFFEDMSTNELRSIENNRFFYGKDTQAQTPHAKLNQYITSHYLFSDIDAQVTRECIKYKCNKDVFIALADNCIDHYFEAGPLKPNGHFEIMALQAGFYIPVPMMMTEANEYEYIIKRRRTLLAHPYVKAPYISEVSAIDMNMDLRYNRYKNKSSYDERDQHVRNLMARLHDEQTLSYGRSLARIYGPNFIELFEIEPGNITVDKLALTVLNNTHIVNAEQVVLEFIPGFPFTVYIEDCVFLVILPSFTNGRVVIHGNVHTIYNLSEMVTVEFDNYSDPKNTVSILISERGNVNDHYACYDDRTLEQMDVVLEDNEDEVPEYKYISRSALTTSRTFACDTEPTGYKAAVKNYYYVNTRNLHPSSRIAEIDNKEKI